MDQATGAHAAQLVREYEVAFHQGPLRGATFEGKRLILAGDAYLLRVAPESGRVVDRFETFPAPGGLAFDGRALWQRSEGSLQQLDARTGIVVQSVHPELEDVTGLECLEGDLLVLHRAGHRLTRMRLEEHLGPEDELFKEAVVVREADTVLPLRGLAWAGQELWSSTRDSLVRIDPATAEVEERQLLPVETDVCDLAADVHRRFWCVDGASDKVRVFSAARSDAG